MDNYQNMMTKNKIVHTAGEEYLGTFALQFADLNDHVLFGDKVWNDSTLSLHDCSMITPCDIPHYR